MNETALANIVLKLANFVDRNYNQLLIVEGTTDKQFMNKIVKNNVRVEDIPTVINARNVIIHYSDDKKQIFNNKQCIIDILNSNMKLIDIYGLVDKDFDTEENIKKCIKLTPTKNKLFITSTHDLETLLISTDLTIFTDYQNLQKRIKTAIYYAYKIGLIKKKIYIPDREIYDKLVEIIISEDGRYDDSQLLLSQTDKNELKEAYYYEDIDDLLSEGTLSKTDILDIANGHDILAILNILCKEDTNRYIKEAKTESHRNRSFEFAIIKKYNVKYFDSKLQLYRNMRKFNMI